MKTEKKNVFTFDKTSEWEFITKKEMAESYPNGRFEMIGETSQSKT